jgi:hypothetical protein
MRSVKAGREPRGRRFRTPRRKARCRAARLSRRCPSTSLVAWSDAVTTVKEKDVAARFRRGDVLLKPQYEPDDGRITMRDATRTVGTALYAQRRDGAQGMRTGRRKRGETGTMTQGGRKGEAQVAQPAAFAEREEAWNDPRLNVEQLMKPEFKAWTRSSLIHTSRSRFVVRDGQSANAGREPSDGVRDANSIRTPGRRSGDVGSAGPIHKLTKHLSPYGPKDAAMPRTNPTPRVSPARGEMSEGQRGTRTGTGESVTRPCTSQGINSQTTATA